MQMQIQAIPMVHSKKKYFAAHNVLHHDLAKYFAWNRSEKDRVPRAGCKITSTRPVGINMLKIGKV